MFPRGCSTYDVYPPRFCSIKASCCLLFHCFNWKYLACAEGPFRLPCRKMKMTVPTIGMKFSGRYMTYRMIAFGVNFANGFFINFPSLAMESCPALICRSLETRFVHSFESSVPSKVSIRASSIRKVRERRLMRVELSLSVRRAAEKAAIGPDVNAITAA